MSFFKAAASLVSKAVKFTAKAVLATAFVGATLAVGAAALFVGAVAVTILASALPTMSPLALAIGLGLILAVRSNANEAKKDENKTPAQPTYAPPPSDAAKIAALQSRSLANDWKAAQQTPQWQPIQATTQQQAYNQDPFSNSGQAPYNEANRYALDYRY